MKYLCLFILMVLSICKVSAQSLVSIKGRVQDKRQQPIVGAILLPQSDRSHGCDTDIDGYFELTDVSIRDFIEVTHPLYKLLVLKVEDLSGQDSIVLTLQDRTKTLGTIEVLARKPITRRFSVDQMTEMDVYQNPMAQGDPLKAINALAASTSKSEQANPEFRGSPSGYAVVSLNKVPIDNPVRYSQLSNQGFFSLFHPSLLDNQWIYASNSPITMAKSLSGLVDIRTKNRLYTNSSYYSLGIGGVGAFLSRRIAGDENFIQIYANGQFSDLMTAINPQAYPEVKSFYSGDLGLNMRAKLSPHLSLNLYAYGITDNFNGESGEMNYYGPIQTRRDRYLGVLNLKHIHERLGVTSLNLGYDTNKPSTTMGGIDVHEQRQNTYLAIEHKFFWGRTEFEGGFSWEGHQYHLLGLIPTYRYWMQQTAPQKSIDENKWYGSADSYLYAYFPLQQNVLDLSLGIKAIAPLHSSRERIALNYQSMLRANLTNEQSLLLGGGHYVGFVNPSTYYMLTPLLSSTQLNADYEYKRDDRRLKGSIFWKKEDFLTEHYAQGHYVSASRSLPSYGAELSWENRLTRWWQYSVAASSLCRKPVVTYVGVIDKADWSYFIKTMLRYNNPRLFNLSVSYVMNRAHYIAKVTETMQNTAHSQLVPTRMELTRPANYHRVDLSISRQVSIGKRYAMSIYATLNNVLGQKNIRAYYYSDDYSSAHPLYLHNRNFYIGCVLMSR